MTVLTCIPGARRACSLANVVAVGVGVCGTADARSDRRRLRWQILYFSVGTVVLGVLGFNAGGARASARSTPC